MCGIIGVSNAGDMAAEIAYSGLFALQHRGQESAGIATSYNNNIHVVRGSGEVSDIIEPNSFIDLPGSMAIGHVRYSTAGGPRKENYQPILMNTRFGQVAIVHNGNLTNQVHLTDSLLHGGSIFQTTSDTELLIHLINLSRKETFEEALIESLYKVHGAFNYLILNGDKLYVSRDPYGFRPLSLGISESKWIVSSETNAFGLLKAKHVRDVERGEVIMFDGRGQLTTIHRMPKAVPAQQCNFELIYFARPDSNVFDQSVYQARRQMGKILAIESPVEADIVVPVPDSGVNAAIGYAGQSGIPYEPQGIIRNHYIGRSFIKPSVQQRNSAVRLKLNPIPELLKDKRVILVDDSIVRGTTSRKIVRMVRGAGAKEVHMRISSPPTIGSCYYGIDTPRREDLIATDHTEKEICQFIEADSLAYLSLAGLKTALGKDSTNFCFACQTGKYPLQEDAIHLPVERRQNV